MTKPSKAIMDFMSKYSIDSDEIWPVPGGNAYAIMHKALQRVAREQGIMMTVNAVEALCNLEHGFAVVKAFGKLGDGFAESYGEASPKNNYNRYPLAMAQKRAEDRVILGLLSVYGDVYSEEEADDFRRPNPHVTRAEDIHEELSGDVKPPAVMPRKMRVKDARGANGSPGEYQALIDEMRRYRDPQELFEWVADEQIKTRIYALPGDWPNHFRGEYAAHMKMLKQSITLSEVII